MAVLFVAEIKGGASMNSVGRMEIYTDEPFITSENIIEVLQRALPKHLENAADIDYLLRYEAGEQPNTATKTTRKDIQNFCPDNLAHKITEFKLGFVWGFPISLVQRGEKDSGKEDEANKIALLNEQYEIAKTRTRTQQLARFIEICGIGYTYPEMNTNFVDGDSYFSLNVLDPRTTFKIKSSYYIDKRNMLDVTYRKDKYGGRHFTCFTKEQRFEVSNEFKIVNGEIEKDSNGKSINNWFKNKRSGEMNPIGTFPIVEWIRSHDGTGCFEHQIKAMNDLNALRSNFMNSIEQNTNSLWHYNDVDFPIDKETGEEKTPKSGDMVRTFTSQDGKVAEIKPLTLDYNYSGLLEKITYDRSIILEECDVPQRSENVSNSTGIATSDATGWSAAENAANKQQCITEDCKMEEVRVVQAIIANSSFVPQDSPLLTLRYFDVKPSIKRQKNYEMSLKTTALANMLSHGIYGLHALNTINLFDDVAQVWADSKDIIEKYQGSLFEKGEQSENDVNTTDGGYEAQISNSPMLDGISKENFSNAEG